MQLDNGFKDRMKWAINFKETNQSELARTIGVTAQAIQQWVAGATLSPRRDHVSAAAEFMGVRYEWLAYGRGPMRDVPDAPAASAPDQKERRAETAEVALLSHEWERLLLAALPDAERAHWQHTLPHPLGAATLRTDWVSDSLIADLGLYKGSNTLVHNARQRLWLLLLSRALLPPLQGRRTVLLVSPLEPWRDVPERHLEALRAEARVMGVEVIHAATPEAAASVLMGCDTPDAPPLTDDLGLDTGHYL